MEAHRSVAAGSERVPGDDRRRQGCGGAGVAPYAGRVSVGPETGIGPCIGAGLAQPCPCRRHEGERVSVRHTLGPTTRWCPLAPHMPARTGQERQRRHQHHRCVGCENQGRPGGRDSLSSSIEVREIVAGDGGSSEPPRRLSGGTCSGSCTGSCGARRRQRRRRCPHRCGRDCPARCGAMCAVRSAGARARAETPVRRVVHRALREPVDGEADTGGARRAAATSRGARSRRSAGERGGHGGHVREEARRSGGMRSAAPSVSVRHRR